MNTIDDGGPAFPHEGRDRGYGNTKGWPHDGMTLRDWFAGQALAGDLANLEGGVWANAASQENIRARADLLYRVADAMIAARKGGTA